MIKTFRKYLYSDNRVGLVILILAFIVICLTTRFKLVDDAYISMRYAYNLAENGALVFNSGEYVEGITNLLWTIILAVQQTISPFPSEQFVLFFSLSLVYFTLCRIYLLGKTLGLKYAACLPPALILVFNPEFIGTATNGLEAALYSALLIEIIYRFTLKQHDLSCAIAVLLFMTRPEGLFFCCLLIAAIYVDTKSFSAVKSGLIIILSSITITTIYRLWYYGLPLNP